MGQHKQVCLMPDELPRYLALKAVMMPRDTNPYGTIFGGVLLSYIDQAGAVADASKPDRVHVTTHAFSIYWNDGTTVITIAAADPSPPTATTVAAVQAIVPRADLEQLARDAFAAILSKLAN